MEKLLKLLRKLSLTPFTYLFLASSLTLGTAYIFQYGFDYFPCEMCYWQRYPYMAVISLAFFGAIHERGKPILSPRAIFPLLWLVTLLLFIDALIAGFHSGVEYGWWQGLTSCTSPIDVSGTMEEVLEQIKNAPLIRCDVPAWTMLGISMAGYNFFAALVMTGFGLYSLKKTVT